VSLLMRSVKLILANRSDALFYEKKVIDPITSWRSSAIVLLVTIKLYLSFCIQSQVSNLVELPFIKYCFRSASDKRFVVIAIFLIFQIVKKAAKRERQNYCWRKLEKYPLPFDCFVKQTLNLEVAHS